MRSFVFSFREKVSRSSSARPSVPGAQSQDSAGRGRSPGSGRIRTDPRAYGQSTVCPLSISACPPQGQGHGRLDVSVRSRCTRATASAHARSSLTAKPRPALPCGSRRPTRQEGHGHGKAPQGHQVWEDGGWRTAAYSRLLRTPLPADRGREGARAQPCSEPEHLVASPPISASIPCPRAFHCP